MQSRELVEADMTVAGTPVAGWLTYILLVLLPDESDLSQRFSLGRLGRLVKI